MNAAERKTYWLQFHRFQQRQEKLYIPQFNKALKAQINQFIEAYRQHRTPAALIAIHSTPIIHVLNPLYRRVGVGYAHKVHLHIRSQTRLKGRQPMGFSPRIAQIMRDYYGVDLLKDAQGITETTRRTIQIVLDEAAESGESFDQIVEKLHSEDMTRERARLIARTETVTAANIGARASAKATGLSLNKIWVDAQDSRERATHREVGGSSIDQEDTFLVGDEQMEQPGDRNASAAEVCNCRCVLAFEPKRDGNGRLIRG